LPPGPNGPEPYRWRVLLGLEGWSVWFRAPGSQADHLTKRQITERLEAKVGVERGYEKVYDTFDSPLSRQIRLEAYGEDVGQHSWVTASELNVYIAALRLGTDTRLLDIGCGPAGPLTYIVAKVGCQAVGLDVSDAAVSAGRARAATLGLDRLVTLRQADSNEPIPLTDRSFAVVISLDVLLHLRDRNALFREVARVLAPGGRFWFTDAGIVTGPVSSRDIELRSIRGYTQFAPPGFNERALERAGLTVVQVEDQTDNLLKNAAGRLAARIAHRRELEAVEGMEEFDREHRYLETVVELAARRALSRFAFVAERS
jgi:SAM-dependent methyltransferase